MTKIVVLDPGHGKNTPGKRSPDGSLLEYEFNQVVADLAEKILIAHGVKVIVTKRMNDLDMGLTQRCNLANNAKADLFLSIHANAGSNDWSTARGWEVFHYPGNDAGQKLANLAAKHAFPEIAKFGVKARGTNGVKSADFAVVRQTKMPAILFEWGFFTNKEECALLKRADFRMACAIGTAKTALAHLGIAYKTNSTTPKPVAPKPVAPTVTYVTHKVASGDTLWELSVKYKVTVDQIKTLNGLKSDVLSIGQILKIKKK